MKLPNFINALTPLEMILAILFILYIIFPVNAPSMISNMVDTPYGMVAIFMLAIYLYVNTHPAIAVLFIFVAYELIRRCCNGVGSNMMTIKDLPAQKQKDAQMKKMNPSAASTLEEDMVNKMAPVGKSNVSEYVSSGFSPIAENVNGASAF
jgi:hypothetical protein